MLGRRRRAASREAQARAAWRPQNAHIHGYNMPRAKRQDDIFDDGRLAAYYDVDDNA